jgi:hypothetical protein
MNGGSSLNCLLQKILLYSRDYDCNYSRKLSLYFSEGAKRFRCNSQMKPFELSTSRRLGSAAILALLLLSATAGTAAAYSSSFDASASSGTPSNASSVQSSSSTSVGTPRQSSPPGYPGDAVVQSLGNSFVSLIENSAQFIALSNDVTFHVEPYSSFGYTWGSGIAPTVRVILYSPDSSAYIVSEVFQQNSTIEKMYFVNETTIGDVLSNPTDNYGGYSSQYCKGNIGSWCDSGYAGVFEAYGNIQVPNDGAVPPSGEDSSCCKFAEWTGVTNSSSGAWLTQGGVFWSGFHQFAPSNSNSNNVTMVTEVFKDYTGQGANFISPPSWMTGFGQTITMETDVSGNCGTNGDEWTQYWVIGSDNTSQNLTCLTVASMTYGWYIFESVENDLTCTGGYQDIYYYCQIPKFSYNGNPVSFTGNICSNTNCEGINSNAGNNVVGYYIDQTTQDTSTSSISSGNAWTEGWVSSVQ